MKIHQIIEEMGKLPQFCNAVSGPAEAVLQRGKATILSIGHTPLLVACFLLAVFSQSASAQYNYTILSDPSAAPRQNGFTGGGTDAEAVSGNTVAGTYEDANGDSHGFFYNLTTDAYTTLDNPSAGNGANLGTSISDFVGNTAIGSYIDASNTAHGFLYDTTSSTYTTLNNPLTTRSSWAHSMSGNLVVGEYDDANSNYESFIYNTSNNTWTNLENPLALGGSYGDTYATSVSGNTIVGWWDDSAVNNGQFNGFLYNTTANAYTTLDDPNGVSTQLLGISGDEVLGTYRDADNNEYPFLYNIDTSQYTALNLDPSGEGDSTTFAGLFGSDIVGSYLTTDSDSSTPYLNDGFIASSVPEPSAWVLLGLCFPAIFALRQRQRKLAS